jgi:ubiquinone/menaquinone biosynthesis C-methylase UbiE
VYLKNAIENKPAYPLLKGFLRTVLEAYPESRTWFDGGAGTCGTMRALRSAGKIVRGIEISDVTKTSCKGLAKEGVVETGVLNDLSRFEDKRFDVVFSSEVLEHVPTHLAEQSVKELVRIAKKDVFVTISLRRSGLDPKDPKKPAIVHLTVWPREKWEKAFVKAGCEINREALKKFEKYDETKYGARPNFFAFTCHHHQKGTTEEENEDEEEQEIQS